VEPGFCPFSHERGKPPLFFPSLPCPLPDPLNSCHFPSEHLSSLSSQQVSDARPAVFEDHLLLTFDSCSSLLSWPPLTLFSPTLSPFLFATLNFSLPASFSYFPANCMETDFWAPWRRPGLGVSPFFSRTGGTLPRCPPPFPG